VLVQQESEIGGRLVSRSDGQEHLGGCFSGAVIQYQRKHELGARLIILE